MWSSDRLSVARVVLRAGSSAVVYTSTEVSRRGNGSPRAALGLGGLGSDGR
jgi:hypothetical protein